MKGTCEQIPFYFFLKFMMLRWTVVLIISDHISDGRCHSHNLEDRDHFPINRRYKLL